MKKEREAKPVNNPTLYTYYEMRAEKRKLIQDIKTEIDYCKTINYYTLFDGKSVQCIPIKTLEEQFNRLIEKWEETLKS